MITGANIQFLSTRGDSNSPGLSFADDPDTGFFRKTTNTVGFSSAGFEIGTLSISNFTWGKPFLSSLNPASAVQYSADGDPNTGLSIVDTTGDTLELITGGTARLTINTTVADFSIPIKPPVMDDTTRDALSPATGWQIFSSTSGKPEWYDGSNWIEADGTVA